MTSILGRYLSALVLSRLAVLLIGMTAIMLFVDFLSDGDQVIAEAQSVIPAMLRYSALRLPSILSEMFPIAAFLAGLLCFTALARHGELAALQAAGLSKLSIALALLPAAVLVAGLQYLVEDLALPAATQSLRDWGIGDYAPDPDTRGQVWVRKDQEILRYRLRGGDDRDLEDVTLFRRDETGNLVERIEAARAVYRDGRWVLEDGRRQAVNRGVPEDFAEYTWTGGLSPEALHSIGRHPRESRLAALLLAGGDSGIGNRPPYLYDLWVQERFASPATTVLLLLLTVALARPGLRDHGSGLWFAAAIGIGFLLWTLKGLFLALGELGLIAPPLAAWVPAAVLVLVGVWLALRIEYHITARRPATSRLATAGPGRACD